MNKVLLTFLAFALNGCTSPKELLTKYAQENNLNSYTYENEFFSLQVFKSPIIKAKDLHIYVEGDGNSYANGRTANDPTPSDNFTLSLLLSDQSKASKVYVARPGQFITTCDKKYWDTARYSIEIIQAYNSLVSSLKKEYKAKNITLIGYSGGATVALMLATIRKDIKQVITFAGVLDHTDWTTHHNMPPFNESLSIFQLKASLKKIFQLHVSGEDDHIVPPKHSEKWCEFINSHKCQRKKIASADHNSYKFIEFWYKESVHYS